jgi:hypothetical protein
MLARRKLLMLGGVGCGCVLRQKLLRFPLVGSKHEGREKRQQDGSPRPG